MQVQNKVAASSLQPGDTARQSTDNVDYYYLITNQGVTGVPGGAVPCVRLTDGVQTYFSANDQVEKLNLVAAPV